MNRPELDHLKLGTLTSKEVKSPEEQAVFETAEDIKVKSFYTKKDTAEFKHLDFAAGIPPYLRGPYSTMYVRRPWTIRHIA